MKRRLAFGELEVLTSLLATELLTFHSTRITSHETLLLESGLVFCIVRNESASDAKTDCTHLASNAAAVSVHFDIPLICVVEDCEREVCNHVLNVRVEVFLKITTIDDTLAGTRLQDNSSDGVLATTGATVDLLRFCGSNSFILRPRNRCLRFRGVGLRAAVPRQRRF